MELPRHILKQLHHPNQLMSGNEEKFSTQLVEISRLEADARAGKFGLNEVALEKPKSITARHNRCPILASWVIPLRCSG